METTRIESLTLVAAVIGSATLSNPSSTFGVGGAAAGDIAILLALFAFDSGRARSIIESLAFGSAGAFCLMTPFQLLADGLAPAPAAARPYWLMATAWAVGTLLLFALDRFRMASRESVSLASAGLAGIHPVQPLRTPSKPSFQPTPIRVEPVIPSAAPAAANREPMVATAMETASPVETSSSPVETSSAVPQPAAAPASPAPDVLAIPPGKEAVIYLNLVGEGLNVLRTVRAENLGRDYYRIADVMPEGEQWEFTPGQVVRCRKKSLSNGKHMVAYEEAPRA